MASDNGWRGDVDLSRPYEQLKDDCIADLYQSKTESDDAVMDAAKKLLYVATVHGDEFEVEEIIDLLSSETPFGKMTYRDYADRLESNRPFWTVKSVVKHEYPDRPVTYEFEVATEFSDGSFTIPVGDLEPDVFKQRMTAAIGVIPDFSEWRVQISTILQQAEVVDHRVENEYAKALVETLESGELKVVDDRTVFKSHPDEAAFDTGKQVLISSDAVMEVVHSVDASLTPQGARRKLDHLLFDGSSKQLRDSEGERYRAWRFKPSILEGVE